VIAQLLSVLVRNIPLDNDGVYSITDILRGLIVISPSDAVLIAVCDSCATIIQAEPSFYERFETIELPTLLFRAISLACHDDRIRRPFSLALFDFMSLILEMDADPKEVMLFCSEPVIFICCMCQWDADVGVACLKFLITWILKSEEDCERFIVNSLAELASAIAGLHAFGGRLGCAALCSRLIRSHNLNLFEMLLASQIFDEVSEFGALEDFAPDEFANDARFHLVLIVQMTEMVETVGYKEEMVAALTEDRGVGSPIDAIRRCAEAMDVDISVLSDDDNEPCPVWSIAQRIVQFAVEDHF
jgi:hypothetical protein